MQYAAHQAEEANRMAAASALLGAGTQMQALAQPRYAPAPRTPMNCTFIGNTMQCW
jgi:hypothetical protein